MVPVDNVRLELMKQSGSRTPVGNADGWRCDVEDFGQLIQKELARGFAPPLKIHEGRLTRTGWDRKA